MKELIGICGQSCVGKTTLAEKLRSSDPRARARFGIPADACVDVFGGRLGRLDDKGKTADYLVWKWQERDHDLIQELANSFPGCRFRLVLIWLPPDVHFERMTFSNNPWHRQESRRSAPALLAKGFAKNYIPRFRNNPFITCAGATVELVDGSTDFYEPCRWPAEYRRLHLPAFLHRVLHRWKPAAPEQRRRRGHSAPRFYALRG